MSDQGPFREGRTTERCPRCDEPLERAVEGALTCLRCGGVWLAMATVTAAFGDPAWPARARGLWWRNELACPVCTAAGKRTLMNVLEVDATLIDRCAAHGLWLDRGELGRVMGGESDALGELRRRLTGIEPDVAAARQAKESLTNAREPADADVARLEAEHAAATERLRRVDAELAAARARVRAIDDELGVRD